MVSNKNLKRYLPNNDLREIYVNYLEDGGRLTFSTAIDLYRKEAVMPKSGPNRERKRNQIIDMLHRLKKEGITELDGNAYVKTSKKRSLLEMFKS